MSVTIEITEAPDPAGLEYISRRLSEFNDADVGPSEMAPLAVFVREEDGGIVAGISGYTAWGWLYVQKLWVSEDLRWQGMAGKMLEAAEREAARRGCHGAFIDTFNPDAARAYRRRGYEEFGALEDFPVGRRRLFLQKTLASPLEAG